MLGELSGLWGGGEVRGEGIGLPTPSLMAWRAFKELLEKVLPPPPPALPGWLELIGEFIPKTSVQNVSSKTRDKRAVDRIDSRVITRSVSFEGVYYAVCKTPNSQL